MIDSTNKLNINWKTSYSAEELLKEPKGRYRKSQKFTLNLGHCPVYLKIICYLKSQDEKGDHIGIYLKLESGSEIYLDGLKMQVSIINRDKKVYFSKTTDIVQSKFWIDRKFGFPQFISHEILHSGLFKSVLADKKLCFRITFSRECSTADFLKLSKLTNETNEMNETSEIMDHQPVANAEFTNSFTFEGSDTDVIIRTSDSVELRAHKCVLKAHSPVFELRFCIEQNKDVFDVFEFNEDVVREFLRFCYTKQIQNALPFIFDLMKMAMLYENGCLVKYCIEIVQENTKISNVFRILDEIQSIQCVELTNFIADFIKRNWQELRQQEELYKIDPKLMVKFMDIFIMGC